MMEPIHEDFVKAAREMISEALKGNGITDFQLAEEFQRQYRDGFKKGQERGEQNEREYQRQQAARN